MANKAEFPMGIGLQIAVDVSAKAVMPATRSGEYSIDRISLHALSAHVLSDWKAFLRESGSNAPMHDPEWLRAHFAAGTQDVLVYLLYNSGSLCGVAPFARGEWPIKWQIGEITLAELPLKRLRVVGGAPRFPNDERAWDLLFRELAASANDSDAVYLDGIPADSLLWSYINGSALLRGSFHRYVPKAPSPHYVLHLGDSFNAYLGKFSSKHRKNRLREIKRVRDGALGEMQFIRYTRPEDVAEFLRSATTVSRKTWQWKLLGEGIHDDDARRKFFIDLAEHGWLRSYALVCGQTAVVYLVGFQYGSRFVFHEFGFDPECSKYSVGTVLLLLTIEDLFAHNRPDFIDLGAHGKYKEAFTNESFLEGSVFLFRHGMYPRFVQAGHQVCQFSSRIGSAVLEKLKWKDKLRRKIRESSLRP